MDSFSSEGMGRNANVAMVRGGKAICNITNGKGGGVYDEIVNERQLHAVH